jgi:hypothetical protein
MRTSSPLRNNISAINSGRVGDSFLVNSPFPPEPFQSIKKSRRQNVSARDHILKLRRLHDAC